MLFLARERHQKGSPPFYAEIVTQDELMQNMKGQKKSIITKKQPQITKKALQQTKPTKIPSESGIKKETVLEKEVQSKDSESVSGTSEKDISTAQIAKNINRDSGDGSNQIRSASPQSARPLREQLFDSSVIGKFAQKERENIKPDNSITFDTKEYKYYGYMQRLKEKIEGIWKYPPDAAEKGIYGDLYIRFTIKKNGQLGAIELIRTSGHSSLDNAAIKALKDAEPFWPLPDEWGKDGFTITGHFIYTLHGAYIR